MGHLNNSDRRGKVLSHQHTVLFFYPLKFPFLAVAGERREETIRVKCAITSSPVDTTAQRK